MYIGETDRDSWLLRFSRRSFQFSSTILACDLVNVKDILQDVQHDHESEHTSETHDRHVRERSRHDLTSDHTPSSDLAVTTGKVAARARTTIVTKQRLTHTAVLACDIHTLVQHRLAVLVRPSVGAFASKLARRCVEASA